MPKFIFINKKYSFKKTKFVALLHLDWQGKLKIVSPKKIKDAVKDYLKQSKGLMKLCVGEFECELARNN